MKKIHILLADDHPVVRSGVRTLLAQAADFSVIGEVSNGAEVIASVIEKKPDVLLLDMKLPGLSGIEVIRQLKTIKSPVRVLGFSAHADAQFVRTMIQNGAAGYLLKEEAPEILIEAVRSVAGGEVGWFSRRAAANMSSWFAAAHNQPERLTVRELDVLALLVTGKTNQEMAAILHISEKTVEKHLHSLFVKFNATSRLEAAVYAVQQGLV